MMITSHPKETNQIQSSVSIYKWGLIEVLLVHNRSNGGIQKNPMRKFGEEREVEVNSSVELAFILFLVPSTVSPDSS